MCSLGGPVFEVGIRTHRFYEMEDAIKLDGIGFFFHLSLELNGIVVMKQERHKMITLTSFVKI